MRIRVRSLAFGAAMVAVAASVSASIVAGGRAALPQPVAVQVDACGLVATASPEAVRDQFVATAVLRRRTDCSYELVTEKMRQGLTRAAWRGGSIPVIPFPTSVPRTFDMQVFPKRRGPASRTSVVVLSAADLGEAAFEVTLVRRGARWLVDYWAPSGTMVAPS
jgi:hypothetical protein